MPERLSGNKGVRRIPCSVPFDRSGGQLCVEQGVDVTCPPTDMPWNVREVFLAIKPDSESAMLTPAATAPATRCR